MPRFAISVKQPNGNWARRDEKIKPTLEAYMSDAEIIEVGSRCNQFHDEWRIIEIPDNEKLPVICRYTPKQ